MPEWIVNAVTVVLVMAFLLVMWTLGHAFKNWRVARTLGDRPRWWATNMFMRSVALFIAVGCLTTIGLLSYLVPRPGWVRTTTSWLLIVSALSIAGVAFHDYRDMKAFLEDHGI